MFQESTEKEGNLKNFYDEVTVEQKYKGNPSDYGWINRTGKLYTPEKQYFETLERERDRDIYMYEKFQIIKMILYGVNSKCPTKRVYGLSGKVIHLNPEENKDFHNNLISKFKMKTK